MEQCVEIEGKKVVFKASAATPRRYRMRFGRDIYQDFALLANGVDEEGKYKLDSLEVFENIAYIMAKQADETIPEDPDAWLDGFGMFSIYEILPQLVSLWGVNVEQSVPLKKKKGRQPGP